MSIAWHKIRDHLMHSSTTLHFQRSFEIIQIAQPPLASFRDPAALLDKLHRGAGDPSHKNRILTSLVQAAHGTGAGADCAIVMLLLALWPGMDAIRHRLVRRQPGSGDEIASELLSRTTEAARSLDLTRVHRIAATILRNVERDMMRARQRDAARESLASDIEPDDVPADQLGRQPAAEDAHLRDDLCKLIGPDALLVLRVAIEGLTQAEAAAELGIPMEAARKRYQRAIKRLRHAFEKNL